MNIIEAVEHMRAGGKAKFLPLGKTYFIATTLSGLEVMQECDCFVLSVISLALFDGEWELI